VPSIPTDIPTRTTSAPTNLQVISNLQGFIVVWDQVYGALGYQIAQRAAGSPDWIFWVISTNYFDILQEYDDLQWEFRVRTMNGVDTSIASAWSDLVFATMHDQTFKIGHGSGWIDQRLLAT